MRESSPRWRSCPAGGAPPRVGGDEEFDLIRAGRPGLGRCEGDAEDHLRHIQLGQCASDRLFERGGGLDAGLGQRIGPLLQYGQRLLLRLRGFGEVLVEMLEL